MVAASAIPQSLERMHYYGIHSSAAFSRTAAKEIKDSLAGLHEKVNHSLMVTNSSAFGVDIKEKLRHISDVLSETKQQWSNNSAVFSQKTNELGKGFAYNTTYFLRKISELLDRIKGNIRNMTS